mgnify:CR=1 FL=1
MLIALPLVLIAAPFGNEGGNFIYKVCKHWASTWYFFVGIRHQELHEAPHDKTKQYIFVANHISYLDIPPIVVTLRQPIRVLGKQEMVNIPIFGWIYKSAVVLVDRSSPQKRAESVMALKAALKNGISVFIFPEGMFNQTKMPLKDFYDGAFRIAIEMQTPIKPMLFVDTRSRLPQKGLFELTPGPSRVVCLAEVSVEGLGVQDLPALKQRVFDIMNAGLLRYG